MRFFVASVRVVALAFLWWPSNLHAAAYGIFEQGAAVLGMAGAGTASVSDACALFFNPAALARLDGHSAYVGGSWLATNNSFAGANPYPGYGVVEKMDRGNFFLPTAYYAGRINERWAVGAGIYAPFGLGVEWSDPSTFTGRYIVTEANLSTVNAGASVAYAFNENISGALGANALFTKVTLENRVLQPIPGGGGAQFDAATVKLETDIKPDYGWNAALSIAPNDAWRIGATYRSKIVVKPDGDATFTQILTGNPALDAVVAASLPPNQRGSTVLRFPAIWAAGVAWRDPGRWLVEADAVFTEWSLFEDLPIRFEQTPANNTTRAENYDDTWAFRTGAEYRHVPTMAWRAGYYFEQEAAPTPSVSPILPDAARHGVTVGAGFDFGTEGQFTVDVYNLALFVEQRSTDGVNLDGFEGEYKSYVNSVGAAFTWRFGGER